MPIIIFAGEDFFRRRRALQKFLDGQAFQAEIQIFESDPSDILADKVTKFFQARTLWGERRAAIVKIASWQDNLPAVNDPDLLVMVLDALPKTGIAQSAEVKEFPKLKGAELTKWIRESAKELGNIVEAPLVSLLIQLYGSDSMAIWNALSALSSLKAGTAAEGAANIHKGVLLSAEDLKTLRLWSPQVRDFAFIKAVSEKDRKQALRLLLYSFEEGIAPLALLGNLASHFRAMLIFKSGGKESADFFSEKHPFWVSKIKEAAASFSEDEPKNYFRRIGRADWLIKTGKHSPETALEELIIGA